LRAAILGTNTGFNISSFHIIFTFEAFGAHNTTMPAILSQMFPPAPTFLPKDVPSLVGKVYIVTGAASGVGFELAKILYYAGGTVYIGARSTARCSGAIEKIRSSASAEKQIEGRKTEGQLGSMVVDLADLSTVKGAAEQFLQREGRLDGLIHNAGVMTPPAGSKDVLVRNIYHPVGYFLASRSADSDDRDMISKSGCIV
jgi:hypothetical protein